MKDAPSGKTFVSKLSNIVLAGTIRVTVLSAKKVMETKMEKVLTVFALNINKM